MPRRTTTAIIVLAAVMTVTGCANTIRGVGRDVSGTVSATGAAVNDVAQQ